ncbi:MAG: serine--tRNA ligase, partial [Ignavibacteria bacterium]|nr:serine--tRNA ligase [Ignavibacteria bacterium]
LIGRAEALKSKRNTVSAEVARKKAAREDADQLIADMKGVSEEIRNADGEIRELEEKLRNVLLLIPNIPHSSVPEGGTPADNQEIAAHGDPPDVDFPLVPHWDLLEKTGIVDFSRGTKITGAGFPVFLGKGARLERALINFFLEEATAAGYNEVSPPLMVNEASVTGTGQLPDKEDQMYVAERDGFYLIPTAEVPVTNLYRDEIISESLLPLKLSAYTPCFRREAGSYGKDVRGLNRVHQFDKVELVQLAHPEQSYDGLEEMREHAESILRKLGLRYRVLLMCAGDLGFTQAKKYDLEVWAPAQKKWLEVSSVSNFESYQARRMNIRFRPASKGKPEIVHTLNGSALALPRVVAALIEHYQTPERKIVIPKVLHSYTGFELIG